MLVIVWKEETDYAREVRDWLHEFSRTGHEIKSIDPETIEGEIFVTAHDLLQYPVILALDAEGKELQKWAGTPLPQIDNVAYWA